MCTGPNGDVDDAAQATTFRWVLEASGPRDAASLEAALREQLTAIASNGGGSAQLWIADVFGDDTDVANTLGFEDYRDLWQLRCDLPLAAPSIETRPFTPADTEAFLRVNNAAFHWHPEQGGFTTEDLHARMAEEWFSAAGFLLHEVDGELAGFNWTKIHSDEDPPLGEIYVIAVDPAFHGRGLGRELTLAGMAHVHAKGVGTGMLYVESDNEAATALYAKVGFNRHSTNRAFRIVVEPA